MKVVRMSADAREPATGDLFIGRVQRQNLVTDQDSQQVRVGVVTFNDGAVNKYHSHTFDQVLVITEGEGIVQVEGQAERRGSAGDTSFFPGAGGSRSGARPPP